MHRLGIAWALSAMFLAWACGGSSGSDLFKGGGTGSCAPNSAVACVGVNSCTGHEQCSSSGQLGACECDPVTGTGGGGGAGGAGASGGAGFGGGTGDGGTTGDGGGTGLGGTGAAGAGGLPGGDTGSGGRTSLPDSGLHGTGGVGPAACPVGQFTIKLTGPYTSILGSNDVGATITFTVDSAGAITGTYSGPSASRGTVAGGIDCSTGAMTATIDKGAYQAGLLPVAFSGTLTGQYDASTRKFTDGTWSLTEPGSPTHGGSGTWTQQ